METAMGRVWKVEMSKVDLMMALSDVQCKLLDIVTQLSSLERMILNEKGEI